MCGIVGLLVKKPELRPKLGEWMLPMLVGMTERGPDSAGLAVYTAPTAVERRKLSLQEQVKRWTRDAFPQLVVLSAGRRIDLYKDVGLPAEVVARYGLAEVAGTHLVGHTRMATESAVTPENAHPYTAGEDWCVVHNGSLSNPYQIRRKLEPLGIRFDGDCDTEAACRYLEWRMREGDDLETAIHRGFEAFDGFYTFLMGTEDKLAIVRDAFACKPAVVAETDDYVAIASEFRSLARLPDIRNATLFEPKPEEIYSWRVQ